jgi:hypothetical protein
MPTNSQTLISASILRLRMKSPAFATLAMFANFIPTQECQAAAIDVKDIFYNEDFIRSTTALQKFKPLKPDSARIRYNGDIPQASD